MQTGPFTICAGGTLQHDKQATSRCLCAARYSALRIPHSALGIRSQNRPPPRSCTLGATGSSAVDRTIRECGMRSAECGMLFADRGDWAMQTGPFTICAGGTLQHDRQAMSRCLCAARYSALRTPHSHSAFVPRTGRHHAVARSEQPDRRPWIERLGNAECGVRNAECCLQIEATGRCRQDRSLYARAGRSNMTGRRFHTALVQHGIPHCAFRIPHSAFVPRTGCHHAVARSEQPDRRPWIERLGNAECGMRNAECCLQIEATGRCRQDRSLYARAGRSNMTSRRRHAAFVQHGIPHCAFRIRSQNRPPPRSCTLGATGSSAVAGTISSQSSSRRHTHAHRARILHAKTSLLHPGPSQSPLQPVPLHAASRGPSVRLAMWLASEEGCAHRAGVFWTSTLHAPASCQAIQRCFSGGSWYWSAVSYMAITFRGGTLACTLCTDVNT